MSGPENWDHVTIIRKKPANSAAAKSSTAINAALRSGQGVETSKKYDRVPLSVGKAMAQGRAAKTPVMSQKDLATAINEKPQVINEYESGKAIPNPQILGKIERVLGIKLRGKDIGGPLGPKK